MLLFLSLGYLKSHNCLREVVATLEQKKCVIVMRGLPGSGKTYLARMIQGRTGAVCSADAFFHQDGGYAYEPGRIKEAHRFCRMQCALQQLSLLLPPCLWDENQMSQCLRFQPRFEEALSTQRELVIIDNTNCR